MRRVAQAQGIFNVVSGLWPLLAMRSFEAVYGPKTDRWLVYTVGGLLTSVGAVQLRSREPDELRLARLLGIGTAATLLAVDLVYVPQGRISRMYLTDAAVEVGWLAAWGRVASRGTVTP
jgi:hypothetical protein